MHSLPVLATILATLGFFAGRATAQCARDLFPFGVPVNGVIDSGHVWDFDGPGPATPVFVFGGGSIFGTTGRNVATYNPRTGAIGSLAGPDLLYEVDALASRPDGQLFAAGGGGFVFPGGSVDRWTGTGWTNIGSANGYVWSLVTLPNGDLVASGDFTSIDGVAANSIARWDGSLWRPLGAGLNARAWSLELTPRNTLLAVGTFTTAGGLSNVGGIAEWNGTAWRALSPGPSVISVAVTGADHLPNGELFGVGVFFDLTSGTVQNAAIWNATQGWRTLGEFDGPVISVAASSTGKVVVGGFFQDADGVAANNLACWDGTNWSAIGAGFGRGPAATDQVISLTALPSGDVMAAGAWRPTPSSNLLALIDIVGQSVVPVPFGGCPGQAAPSAAGPQSSAAGITLQCPTLSPACSGTTVILFGSRAPSPIPLAPPLGCSTCTLVITPIWGTTPSGTLMIPPGVASIGTEATFQCACIATSCITLSPGVTIVVVP